MQKYAIPCFLAAAMWSLSGCATFSEPEAEVNLPAPSVPADAQLMPGSLADPLEPVNRVAFAIDESLFHWVVDPASQGYQAIMPEPARKGVRHFRQNLFYPVRLGNNVLQGKLGAAGRETKRFLINTTVGVLGFSDPATSRYNIAPANEDLGQTFGVWGWNHRYYLYMPLAGAGSTRDYLGRVGDVFMDPASLAPEGKAALEFNTESFNARSLRQILQTEYDAYALKKLYYTQERALAQADARPSAPAEKEDTAATQTLEAMFAQPEDPDFALRSNVRQVQLAGFRKAMPYSLWAQKGPAPVAFVLPGLGGHRHSTFALALAEMAHAEGYHVICFSNNLNWEFIQAAPDGFLPGYVNDDIKYIKQLHAAAAAQVAATLGAGRVTGKPAVMGFSMGGWYTLNLCATSPAGTYSKALSINPPLDLTNGLKALDSLYRAPAGRDDLATVQASALAKLMVNQHATGETGFQPGFTDVEASYLIGLSYRFTLRNTIINGLGLKRSRGVYARVDPLSYQDYYDQILRPRLLARGEAAADIDASVNLRTREAGLMAEPNLKLVLTGNDFLLTAEDLAWFRERFGDRVIYTEKGSHMGQLWWPEVKKAMREAIRPAQP